MAKNKLLVILICTITGLLTGCGAEVEKPVGMPDLYPCTLTLVQEGQPLVGATVQTISEDAGGRWGASGITNEQGEAVLITYGKYHGVQAGKHHVIVNKQEADAAEVKMEAGIPVPGAGTLPKVFTLVEKRYTHQKTTPLELEIAPGQSNDQTFDCGRAIREKL